MDWEAVSAYNAKKAAEKASQATVDWSAALDTLSASGAKAAQQTETLADQITKADQALTESQNAYKTLSAAVDEYNETSTISLSTWQDLMGLAPEYQALLSKQGDQLVIDTAAYNELTAAQRLEIETLVTQNGVTAETIQLLDSLGLAAEETADKAGTAFSELKDKIQELVKGGPLEVVADLADALRSGDWSGAASAIAQGLWLTITPDQQDAIAGWAVQAVQSMTDGFTNDGWAGLINAGAVVVQGLADGITAGESIFLDAVQGLVTSLSGIGGQVMPAVTQAALSLLNAFNLLVPGIDLASGATAIFNAILAANTITSASPTKADTQTDLSADLPDYTANTDALEENTAALEENTELIRNPPRYQTEGGGPTTSVTDYSAMLAAARAAVLAQNTRAVTNYDAGSGQTTARLNASWKGTSTTVLNLDGREVARAVTPYVDEDMAF